MSFTVKHRKKSHNGSGSGEKSPRHKTVYLDELCQQLLGRTADRSGISVRRLVNCSVEGFLTSISKHLEPPSRFEGDSASKNHAGNSPVLIDSSLWQSVVNYAAALEVSPQDILRDCVLAQKPNFDRLHIVNARNFSSIRAKLFRLEQKPQ